MNYYEILKSAANATHTPLARIGESMGKTPNYVAAAVSRGSSPSVDNAAAMLNVCGWSLVALPKDQIPEGALVVDATAPDTPQQRAAKAEAAAAKAEAAAAKARADADAARAAANAAQAQR